MSTATRAFKGGTLTNVGRALTKHPEVVGLTKATLRSALRTDGEINAAAQTALTRMLNSGQAMYKNHRRHGAMLEVRALDGFGARFSQATSEFLGFINP